MTFASMTLEAQLEHLATQLAAGTPATELLELCATLRDHAPLAWLSRELLHHDWLADDAHSDAFAGFLQARSETAVHQMLRALTRDLHLRPRAQQQALSRTLLRALEDMPLRALSSMCLVDRALKHNDEPLRTAHVRAVVERALDALERGDLEALTDSLLVQVPASANARMHELAERHGPDFVARLEQQRRAMARSAIEVLGNAPKAVSQANAEELLARRVYTDPGHFLIELLQNAEDAGARTWRVVFDADRVVVWHDGTAFDARDLVGVTSIGQTTKRKQQIGFFGVGFKSVFEVTDRPRVYSDVFNFEIADVSIPRWLADRPDDVPPTGTVLVLPLRDPDDPVRSPAALYEKARAIDPCVLFTLPQIDVIDLELTSRVARGPRRHTLREHHGSWSSIRQTPDDWTRTYALHDAPFEFEGGHREAGRATATRIMVGVLLDEAQTPRRLEPDAATIYSYLPTAEPSGLGFWLQAHFDVPVDRERITVDSDWNRWVLANVPTQLACIATQLTAHDRGHSLAARHRMAAGFLTVLPLPGELNNPVYRPITEGLADALRNIALVPGQGHDLHRPADALIASPAMLRLFGMTPLDARLLDPEAEAGHTLHFASTRLPTRSLEVLRQLGCRTLDVEGLVAMLERVLGPLHDGHLPDPGLAPDFLVSPQPLTHRRLFELLLTEIEALERTDMQDAADALVERLRALPLVPGTNLTLHRAHAERPLVRARQALRDIYGALRGFVHADLDIAVHPMLRVSARQAVGLLERLGIEAIELDTVLDELEAEHGARDAPLDDLDATRLPGSQARLARILDELASGPVTQQHTRRRAAGLPLFRGVDGRHHRAATARDDHRGVLRFVDSPGTRRLLDFYGARRPILAPDLATEPAGQVLEQLDIPALDIECLLDDLRARPDVLVPDLARLRELHALLETLRDELPARVRRALAELHIWPDRHGHPGAIKGGDLGTRVLVPVDEAVVSLFPAARFLDADICARTHLAEIGVDRIGVDAVVRALLPQATPPLHLEPTPGTAADVLRFLLERTGDVGPRVRERLLRCPVFMDDRARVLPLAELTLAPDDLRALYPEDAARNFLDADGLSMQLVRALELDTHLRHADATTLVDDLAELADHLVDQPLDGAPLLRNPTHLARILAWLGEHATTLSRASLQTLAALPIVPDQDGRLSRLAPFDPTSFLTVRPSPGTAALVEPDLTAPLRLAGLRHVDPALFDIVAPLAHTLEQPAVSLLDLLDALDTLAPVAPHAPRASIQHPEPLDALHQVCLAHREALATADVELDRLAIWPTLAGAVLPARDLIDDAALRAHALFDAPLDEHAWHLHGPPTEAERTHAYALTWQVAWHRPTHRAATALDALDGHVERPDLAAGLARLADALVVPGRSIAEQPPPFDTLDRIARMLEIRCQARDEDLAPPPLVDANGHLRTDPLLRARPDTVALVAGLPLSAELLHPSLYAASEPLALDAVDEARVLAALEAPSDEHDTRPPVTAHPVLRDANRRQCLYAWIEGHARALFTDPTCIELLRHRRLFVSERGTLLSASELVIDADLPALGIDWRPASEVPGTTLDLLQRHLDAGRPDLDALLDRHLMPALHTATDAGDGERAGELVRYLARAMSDRSPQELRQKLRQPDGAALRLEDEQGRFRPADTLLLPSDAIAGHVAGIWGADYPRPSTARYPATIDAFLVALGVATEPSHARICEAMEREGLEPRAALGLAAVVGHLWHLHGRELESSLPLRRAAWLLDGAGRARKPGELFAWSAEVESLVGTFDELYLDAAAARHLGDALLDRLGLRGLEHVELDHVVRHIDASIASGQPLPFRVYQWIEQGLTAGWLDGAELERALAGRAWIYTEGRHHMPERVIGSWALHIFGERRGYWERGHTECPRLCRRFRIPGEPTPDAVHDFLVELGGEVAERGGQALLDEEPALRRMLLACYALLGRARRPVGRTVPVLLCRRIGPAADGEPGTVLRAAAEPGTLRSDTPTLEALFEEVGAFFLVARGNAEQRADIDAFYDAVEVPRLRDAYSVTVDESSGRDVSERCGPQIQRLRATLRALHEVLPRVRLARAHLAPNGWVHEARLEPLTTTRPVRAIEQLTVCYGLEGVGTVRTRMSAAWDPERRELLVDPVVLDAPARHTTALAVALMSCIYDGPGEDQLVDIIEILLPQGSASAMHAYLDQRHFPAVDSTTSPTDRIAERIGAILDYGLGHRLVARFRDELGHADLERWREPSLLAGLELTDGEDRPRQAARIASTLLAAVGLEPASQPLREVVTALFAARALDEIPASLLATEQDAATDDAPLVEINRPVPGAPGTLSPPRDAIAHARQRWRDLVAGHGASAMPDPVPGTPQPPRSPSAGPHTRSPRPHAFDEDEALDALLQSLALARPPAHRGVAPMREEMVPGDPQNDEKTTPYESPDTTRPRHDPAHVALPDATPDPVKPGFWTRVAGLFGGGRDVAPDPALFQPPGWTGANCMAPAEGIQPQLWATPEAFRTLEQHPPSAALRFEPGRLPLPWIYAPLSVGSTFDAATQSWAPQRDFSLSTWLTHCRPTGRTVRFAGQLLPGASCLPIPLYARLTGALLAQTPDGRHVRVRRLAPEDPTDGRIRLETDQPAIVRYEVDLLTPGALTPHDPSLVTPMPDGPTVSLDTLPTAARYLVRELRTSGQPAAARALAVQQFVRQRYDYDADFVHHPRVARARARLRPGRGNHHLDLLHASGDDAVLGRGICFELNLLVVELLRHLDIPAYAVSGWVLDQGTVSRPSHLFALALVPGAHGICLLPLDAAVDARGPRRALPEHIERPDLVDDAPPPPPGVWQMPHPHAESPPRDPGSLLEQLEHIEQVQLTAELRLATTTLAHVARVTGRTVPTAAQSLLEPGTATTRAHLQTLVGCTAELLDGDHRLAATLTAVLRGDLNRVDRVPGTVQTLAARGLVDVQTVPAFEVRFTG